MARLALPVTIWAAASTAGAAVLYQTGFETNEGFDPQFTLAGQNQWTAEGTGGNGLLNEAFPDMGQQAYIGFFPPTDTNEFTSVWRPIDYDPVPAGTRLVKFSTLIQFVPSESGGQDDFRWSVYNTDADRLFSVDFETSTTRISYVLQDGVFADTGWTFDFEGVYQLDVWMDFTEGVWTAFLNDTLIVHAQPLTQNGSALTFGDADAVWAVRDIGSPGDNYMLFDNYTITAEDGPSIPVFVESAGISDAGFPQFTIYGQPSSTYSVEVTSDFQQWYSLGEDFKAPDSGQFLFEDTTAAGHDYGFYRIRAVE
jgi:hypothetical protein